MGKSQRSKGRRGETQAKELLTDRDYTILADTSAGVSQCDLLAQCPEGKVWAVEVKNTKSINVSAHRKQAIAQSGKLPWLLLCKIDGTSSWLVLRYGMTAVWHEKGGGV